MSTYQTSTISPQADVDVGALLRAIWRNRGWITAVVLSVGIAAYLAMGQMTPLYTSQVHILIDNGETAFTRPASDESGRTQESTVPDAEAVASQVQVLLSRDLALEVIYDLKLDQVPEFAKAADGKTPLHTLLRMLGLEKKPTKAVRDERLLDAFMKRLDAYPIQNSRVINVEFSAADPQVAARVANRLAEAYLKWQQREKLNKNRNASLWLSEQVTELRKKVEASEAAVERFRSKTGLFSGSNNVTLNTQQLSELNSQLILAKAQRTEAEARAKLITKMLKDKGAFESASDVLHSALIQRLSEQRVRVQRQLSELSATLLPSHPRIKELKSELESVRQQILAEARKVVKSLENEAQIAGAREASLRASLDEIKHQASEASESQIELRSLEREAKANRDLLESYLARLRDASARNDELSVPAHANIISKARPSDKPSTPKPWVVAVLAAAGTAVVLMALIVTVELLSASRAAAAGGGSGSSWIAMGMPRRRRDDFVEPAGERRAAPVAAQPQPQAPGEDVAGRLLAASQGLRGYRVLIAPDYARYDAAGEALALARELAATGRSVVLVDCSQDQEGLGPLLGLQGMPGLNELMNGETNFEQVIRRDGESALQLIARGRLKGQPGRAANAARIFGALDEIYDLVLVYANGAMAQAFIGDHQGHIAASVVISDPNAMPQPGEVALRQWLAGSPFRGPVMMRQASQPARTASARLPWMRRAATL